jgi:hypothetical protein
MSQFCSSDLREVIQYDLAFPDIHQIIYHIISEYFRLLAFFSKIQMLNCFREFAFDSPRYAAMRSSVLHIAISSNEVLCQAYCEMEKQPTKIPYRQPMGTDDPE